MKTWLSILLTALMGFASAVPSQAQVKARNGMVVSTSGIASDVGVEVLKKGGNAVDAAVATAFALAVTHPAAGNIGGGGFLVYMKSDGAVTTIDFREKAPLKATRDMYLDEKGELIRNENHLSVRAIGVTGTVAGLYKAHQKYGRRPWATLVQPAIDLATLGFEMNWSLAGDAQYFVEQKSPFMSRYFLGETGKPTAPGEVWKQPALAGTLTAIRDRGHDGFYRGEVARKIAGFMQENSGLITEQDLARYEAMERPPVKGTYKDYEIYSMPPPSSGGVALVEMMNLMELADFKKLEFNSAAYVHFLAEAMRRAFADRAEFLGDPDFNPDMPLERLISKAHAKKRYAEIDMSKASVSDSTRFGQLYDGDSTTHFSVMDGEGNAVSLTYTLEYGYGSRMGSTELGFIFNNEMGDFNPIPGTTTSNWLIGTRPNLIEPEKRMLSSMTPTIVAKHGKPYLVIGSPGGRTIINTVFQTVLNVLEFDMEIDKAIEVMKIHHQWLPDRINYEKDLLSPDTGEILRSMGHAVVEQNSLCELMGIRLDAENDVMIGASDSSSSEGKASGY